MCEGCDKGCLPRVCISEIRSSYHAQNTDSQYLEETDIIAQPAPTSCLQGAPGTPARLSALGAGGKMGQG